MALIALLPIRMSPIIAQELTKLLLKVITIRCLTAAPVARAGAVKILAVLLR